MTTAPFPPHADPAGIEIFIDWLEEHPEHVGCDDSQWSRDRLYTEWLKRSGTSAMLAELMYHAKVFDGLFDGMTFAAQKFLELRDDALKDKPPTLLTWLQKTCGMETLPALWPAYAELLCLQFGVPPLWLEESRELAARYSWRPTRIETVEASLLWAYGVREQLKLWGGSLRWREELVASLGQAVLRHTLSDPGITAYRVQYGTVARVADRLSNFLAP